MDMGDATTDCLPCHIDADVWTQCARHGPGQQKGRVSVTNRSIVYRLHPPEGEPFLVVLNGLWVDQATDQPFVGLRKLEEKTGARVRYILSPGASHHLSLSEYAKAFPDARVLVAEGRIPRTNPDLLALGNVEAYPVDAPPGALAAAGLRLLVVRGLMEGPGAAKVQRFTAGKKDYVCDSTEPLMAFHEPTGAVSSGGHQWWFVPEGQKNVFSVPWIMSMMLRVFGLGFGYMTPGAIACETNNSFAIHDRDALQASAREILSWEFDGLIDLHAQPNTCPKSGAKALFEAALGPIAAGDWERVPWSSSHLPGG